MQHLKSYSQHPEKGLDPLQAVSREQNGERCLKTGQNWVLDDLVHHDKEQGFYLVGNGKYVSLLRPLQQCTTNQWLKQQKLIVSHL